MRSTLTYEQASRGVSTACTEILNSDLSLEGKLLYLDDFSMAIVSWYKANLIEKWMIDSLQRQVAETKICWKRVERRKKNEY